MKYLGVLFIVPLLILGGVRVWEHIDFNRKCEGHLKRAADANTVELATQEMRIAVGYIEANQLTEGYTSVLYTTPKDDVGFWYQNLKASLEELERVPEDATQLERSNVLMKLRETLLDDRNSSATVTVPPGISVFPHNKEYVGGFIFFGILALIGVYMLFHSRDGRGHRSSMTLIELMIIIAIIGILAGVLVGGT